MSAEKAFTFATKKDNAPTKLEHSTEDNIADRTFVNTNIDAEQKTCIKCTSPSSTKDAVCTVWDRSGQQDGQKLAAKLETNSVNKVELYNLPNEFSPELTECCIIGSKTKVEPVTHENIDFIPRFKVGDWIMYRERKMILVRMDKTHQNDQKEQFWMVKSENSERLSRIKAKNMTLIVV